MSGSADEWLSAEQAAALLGISRRTLYAYVSRGLVVSESSGGKQRRYPRWSLEQLQEARGARRAQEAGIDQLPRVESALTLIDRGRLFYRGQDAIELSRSATFEQVACLLWTGTTESADRLLGAADETGPSDAGDDGLDQPDRSDAAWGRDQARGRGGTPGRAPLAERLVACLVDERRQRSLSLVPPAPSTYLAAGRIVNRMFVAAGATGTGTLAERLARGWRASVAEDLRAALILCADHELNASAFTARVVAATDAPLANALLAALCALEGRRHGGATWAVSEFLDDAQRIGARRAGERAVSRSGWLPGLWRGETIYPDGDPRAVELLRRLDLPARDPIMQAVGYMNDLGGGPSVDFALAALARRSGLPRDAPYAIFALGRTAGWIAHAIEAAAQGRLIRPRARYTGPAPAPESVRAP